MISIEVEQARDFAFIFYSVQLQVSVLPLSKLQRTLRFDFCIISYFYANSQIIRYIIWFSDVQDVLFPAKPQNLLH